MNDSSTRKTLTLGWLLLAFSLPLGLTLEVLHALKVSPYLDSAMRRELWTLAHAHGNLLGILCLVFASVGERTIPGERTRRRISRGLRFGAVLMPLGFLLGGILNHEGDPSLGILLVPVGGLALIYAVIAAAISAARES